MVLRAVRRQTCTGAAWRRFYGFFLLYLCVLESLLVLVFYWSCLNRRGNVKQSWPVEFRNVSKKQRMDRHVMDYFCHFKMQQENECKLLQPCFKKDSIIYHFIISFNFCKIIKTSTDFIMFDALLYSLCVSCKVSLKGAFK